MILWTVAHQAPSKGFSKQEYWSGLPFPSPGDLPDPGIEPKSPTLQAGSLPSDPPSYPYQTGSDSKAWPYSQKPFLHSKVLTEDFPGGPVFENLSASAGDSDVIPG